MNIKSLLLGSAAALLAVSGARAADAVVMAEPEPVDYVRVCDVYGAGFYYIPGTETCLSISGYVWYQINAASGQDYWTKNVRARLNFDARSETEWGTLRGYIRLQGDWDPQNQVHNVYNTAGAPAPIGVYPNNGDGEVKLDQAFIELGGLRMGYTESAWDQSQYGGASNWGSHSWGGLSYAYQERHLIAYSFQGGNGLVATLSLEDDGNVNYVPDFVGKVAMNQGWGSVWAKVAYDEDIAPATASRIGARAAGLSGVSGWAASLGAQINIASMPGDSFRLIGFYANNANAYSVGGRWSILASYNHVFSPMFSASAGVQYISDTNYAAAGNPNLWMAEVSLVATPVKNFEVRTEITYSKPSAASGSVGGFLRFTRYF